MGKAGVRDASAWIALKGEGVGVTVKVRPGAKRSEVRGVERDAAGVARLSVHVNAPPVDGKANGAVLKLLAKRWGLPVSRLSVVSGATARIKVIEIADGDAELVATISVLEEGRGLLR